MEKKAVFLDRDGVLNKTVFRMGKPRAPYSLAEFEFMDGVENAVPILKQHGFVLIIVTNQPDVARGWVELDQVNAVNDYIQKVLRIDAVKTCFHTEKDSCDCRKPMPGMLLEAAKEMNIDLKKSFMIGDRYSDVLAGKSAQCSTVLIGEGDVSEMQLKPDYCADSLLDAAKWIAMVSDQII